MSLLYQKYLILDMFGESKSTLLYWILNFRNVLRIKKVRAHLNSALISGLNLRKYVKRSKTNLAIKLFSKQIDTVILYPKKVVLEYHPRGRLGNLPAVLEMTPKLAAPHLLMRLLVDYAAVLSVLHHREPEGIIKN